MSPAASSTLPYPPQRTNGCLPSSMVHLLLESRLQFPRLWDLNKDEVENVVVLQRSTAAPMSLWGEWAEGLEELGWGPVDPSTHKYVFWRPHKTNVICFLFAFCFLYIEDHWHTPTHTQNCLSFNQICINYHFKWISVWMVFVEESVPPPQLFISAGQLRQCAGPEVTLLLCVGVKFTGFYVHCVRARVHVQKNLCRRVSASLVSSCSHTNPQTLTDIWLLFRAAERKSTTASYAALELVFIFCWYDAVMFTTAVTVAISLLFFSHPNDCSARFCCKASRSFLCSRGRRGSAASQLFY